MVHKDPLIRLRNLLQGHNRRRRMFHSHLRIGRRGYIHHDLHVDGPARLRHTQVRTDNLGEHHPQGQMKTSLPRRYGTHCPSLNAASELLGYSYHRCFHYRTSHKRAGSIQACRLHTMRAQGQHQEQWGYMASPF